MACRIAKSWAQLASQDAAIGYQAQWTLQAQPVKTVAYLKQKLQFVPVEKGKRIEELLAKLSSAAFAERARADAALRKEGRLAVPVLRAALTRQWPLETRRRIETLLRNLEAAPSAATSYAKYVRSPSWKIWAGERPRPYFRFSPTDLLWHA